MINRKYSRLLFAIIMGFFMVFVISFVNVIIKNGLDKNFIFAWLKSFCIGYPIAIPLIIVVPQWINKIIYKITYE